MRVHWSIWCIYIRQSRLFQVKNRIFSSFCQRSSARSAIQKKRKKQVWRALSPIYIYMNLKKKKRGCPSPHSNFRTLPSYQWEGIYFAPRNIPRNTMFLTWGRRLAVAVLEYWALDPADWWMLHENRSKPNLCATEIISNYCSRPVCQNLHPSQRRPYFVSYTVLIA